MACICTCVHTYVRTRFPYLRNGWTDRGWNLVCGYVSIRWEAYISQKWGTSARAYVHTPFPYLANGWVDCVQILCMARDPFDKTFTQVRGGLHLHVRMCTPLFHTSQMAGRIAFKFGVWLGTHYRRWAHTIHMWGASARAHVRTPFVRWCLLTRSSIANEGALLVVTCDLNFR